jgi:dienelactone hydrolase
MDRRPVIPVVMRTNEDVTAMPTAQTAENWSAILVALFVLALGAALVSSAYAQPSLSNEEAVRIPVMVRTLFGTKQLMLEGTTYRPDGDGPFPLAVLNHGSPRTAADRRNRTRERYPQQSAWFLARGFAVMVPMRRGYAGSEGDWAEGGGPCDRSNWYLASRESAKDIRAAVEFMQARPFIDRSRALLVGQSAGGFGVLALAAEGVEGLKGVVNFAGGRGSPQAGKNCSPENVIYSMGQFGRTTKVPTLWIYNENDSYFSVPMIQEMHAAFRKRGGDAELVLLPPFGTDGHLLFSRGVKLWSPLVESFLDRLGLLGPAK